MKEVVTIDNVRRSKVTPPRLPVRLLPRPQLMRDVQQAMTVRVTMVIAGAGYGKTTMIAQALEELAKKRDAPAIAWLQLDEFDVDRVALFSALVAAVEQGVPGFFRKWLSHLALMTTQEFAQRFSDELGAVNKEVVIVIEDIHWLLRGEKEAYNALSPIVDQLPNNVHAILTSRKVLMMECAARMRSRQQLLILGKEKLTMSIEEVRRLLHDVYEEDVPDELVRRIAAQVEGWVTGVVLLLQARYVLEIQAWDTFLGLISGDSHEFFFAYFMSEVYERLSENMRRCLRLVAELPEWDVKAVKDVYGDDVTRELARYVSDENALFVFPTDDRRTRFRFHPMFRDFLRAQGPLAGELIHQLAEHEFALGHDRIASMLFRQSKSWQRMLEALYHLMLVARRESISLSEVKEMMESVPSDLRHTFPVWWVMRASQLIFGGEVSEVSKLPCNYKTFKEPYKTKFLGLLSLARRNEGRPGEVIDMLKPVVLKYLKKPEKVFPAEAVTLVVIYSLCLIDLYELNKAADSVKWLEQRKLIAPESKEDELVLTVLRAFYGVTKQTSKAIYYAQKTIEYCREFKALLLPNELINLGALYSEHEFFTEAIFPLMEGLDIAKRMGLEPTIQLSYAELAFHYLRIGDVLKCEGYLQKITPDRTVGNGPITAYSLSIKAEAAIADYRLSDVSFMNELQEYYSASRSQDLFSSLSRMYRTYQPNKVNTFVEMHCHDFDGENGAEPPLLIQLVVESERKRMDSARPGIWEQVAKNLVESSELNNPGNSFSAAGYYFEIIRELPDLAAPLLSKTFAHGAYLVINYLKHEWTKIDKSTKIILLGFLEQKLSSSFVAKELSQILRSNPPDDALLEQSRLFDLLTTSEFLTEEEIGPLLLKYRSLTPSAENALREFSNRDPDPLTIKMFGKFEIKKGEKKLEFSKEVTQPMISVLKLLLRKRDEVLSLDVLADQVWRDVGSKPAKNNVYAAISQLRTALEPYLLGGKDSHFIKAADRGYVFEYRMIDVIDADEFETMNATASKQRGERAAQTLIQAVKLYRGKFLEENQYDEWADADRERFHQMYVKDLQIIVNWYRKVNAWDDVEMYGTSGFALEPENEDFCGALLECAVAKREMYSLKKVFSDHQNARNELFGDLPSKGMQELYQTCLDKL